MRSKVPGAASRDKTVGAKADEILSAAQLRAVNLREEAYGIASKRIKEILKDAETVSFGAFPFLCFKELGNVDAELLTSDTDAGALSEIGFCSPSLSFPAPEVLTTKTVAAYSLTEIKTTGKHSLPVFSFL